ncbi:MAG: ribonuclease III [Micavibrio aeruginosavorus]|uniref:Ribonuclease 3 n=1 Tax=Micavibrio aeruginosavorus TaxID=349221 RepID=A0A2W5MXD6_9BACT|nr:MAG: ribonuclease III [Micavibrio aeruginosavorus]
MLEERLGYRFKNRAFMEQALTHSSRSGQANNERIEFLGDRVLNLVMAESLFRKFPDENEGSLAKRHSALVQGRMLAIIGAILDLSHFVNLSESERLSGGAENENIISDAMEALLGAIFLDGGLEPAREVILRLWGDNITTLTEAHQDPKTELQEWVQARGLPLPEYEIVDRSGPDHAPTFAVEVRVRDYDPVVAEGPSRRQAEKTAARQMLIQLKVRP